MAASGLCVKLVHSTEQKFEDFVGNVGSVVQLLA